MLAALNDIATVLGRSKSVYDYVDVVQVWLTEPLSPSDLRHLNAHSGKLRCITKPAWWEPRYQQVIQLYQPDQEAIQLLTARNDGLVNYVEIALDFIFDEQRRTQ